MTFVELQNSQRQVKSLSNTGQELGADALEKMQSRKNLKAKNEKQEDTKTGRCGKCGRMNKSKECPAYGKKCHFCQKMNYFEKMCKQKTRTKQINQVEADTDESFYIGTLEVVNELKVKGPGEWGGLMPKLITSQ